MDVRGRGSGGQASVEWLGAVALVALVLTAATGVLGGEAMGAAVVRQVHRALCVVSHGVCDLDRRPCVVAADATEDEAHVNLGVIRLSRHELVLHELRSDGTVRVTYVHDNGVGWDVGVGSDTWAQAAGRQWAAGTAARVALILSLGGGETWEVPDGRAADRLMAELGEGRTPTRATRAERIVRTGVELDADAQAVQRGVAAALHLSASMVDGVAVDERDGRRTHVVTHRAAAAGLLKLPGGKASGDAASEERLAVTTDASGRPLELSVVRTGDLAGALSLPKAAQSIAGGLLANAHGDRRWVVEQRLDLTDPDNLRAAQGLLAALDGPAPIVARAGDALRARLAEAGVTEARTYAVDASDSDLHAHGGVVIRVGGGIRDHTEMATLADARVRGPDGEWRTRSECLAGSRLATDLAQLAS